MEHLLKNPDPKYYLERGQKCYLAVNNAQGGLTITAEITGKTTVDMQDHYSVRYMDPNKPGREIRTTAPVNRVFASLSDVATARRSDDSLQLKNVQSACLYANGLFAFLLSRAELTEAEKDIVIAEAKRLELYQEEIDM